LLHGGVDHEQSGKEHQQMPVDQAQHLPRCHLARGEQHTRGGQRHHVARRAGEQEGGDHRHHHDDALECLPPVVWRRGDVGHRCGAMPAAAIRACHDRPDAGQADQRRNAGLPEISRE
jgi:hypothetical protein